MSRVAQPSSTRGLMVCFSLSVLMASLDSSIANTGLPIIARAFDVSFSAAQWVVLAYLLAVTVIIVGAGRLGDHFGRHRLLIAGIALFTAASAICGFAPNFGILITGRVIQGIGAATMLSLTLASVSDAAPKSRTATMMGVLGTMSAAGTALGPSLGGILSARFGWESIFLVNVPIGIVAVLLAMRFSPPQVRVVDKPAFDVFGTILLGVGLAGYALAMTAKGGVFGWKNIVLIWGGITMSLLVSTVLMSTLVVGPFYLSRGLGLDPATVGLILSVGPAVVALSGVPAGRLADRFGTKRLTLVGLIGIASGSLLLALLPLAAGIGGYVLGIVVITSGYAAFQTANNVAVLGAGGSERRGVVSGMLNLARNLGLITGASFMGAVFATASGGAVMEAGPAAVSMGLRATFLVATVLALIAVGVARRSGGALAAARFWPKAA